MKAIGLRIKSGFAIAAAAVRSHVCVMRDAARSPMLALPAFSGCARSLPFQAMAKEGFVQHTGVLGGPS